MSSASRISHASALHALQSKSHAPKAAADDSFADMLGQADATPPAEARQAKPAAGEREKNDTDGGSDKPEETRAAAPVAATAPVAAGNDGQDDAGAADNEGKPAAPKVADKAVDKNSGANDTGNDTLVLLPQPVPAAAPLQLAMAAPAAAATNDNEAADSAEDSAPARVNAPAAPQLPAPQGAAAPAEGKTTDGTAGAKAAKTGFQDQTAADKPAADAAGNTAKNDDAAPVQPGEVSPAAAAPSHQPAPQPAANNTLAAAPALPAAPANHAAPAAAAPSHPAAAAHAPNVDGLAVAIFARAQGGARQFDIRLDPPELGRVEVRLSIDAAGKAQAHLTADQPDTLNLLRQDAPALTRALRDAGLDVNQDGLNFSLRNQQQQADNGHQGRGFARAPFSRASASLPDIAAAGGQPARALGLLDIRV